MKNKKYNENKSGQKIGDFLFYFKKKLSNKFKYFNFIFLNKYLNQSNNNFGHSPFKHFFTAVAC